MWSVVFPLGMYSAATFAFGAAAGLSFLEPLSRVMFWIALAVWGAVVVAVALALGRRMLPGGQPPAGTASR